MSIHFTKAPTFTKAITASAVFAVAYLASTSNLPPCSDTVAILSSGKGECLERASFLHVASGWLALICLLAAVLLLALKYRGSLAGRPEQAQMQHAYQGAAGWGPQGQAPQQQAQAAAQSSGFCVKCG